jgi:hypothetical protein
MASAESGTEKVKADLNVRPDVPHSPLAHPAVGFE